MFHEHSVFVFGSKIFPDTIRKQDPVSSLPLELSWKIFSYLDDQALRMATRVDMIWKNIIVSNKKLKERLNFYELSITLGSQKLAEVYRNVKKKRKRRYLPMGVDAAECTKKIVSNKRGGSNLVMYTKRFKLI